MAGIRKRHATHCAATPVPAMTTTRWTMSCSMSGDHGLARCARDYQFSGRVRFGTGIRMPVPGFRDTAGLAGAFRCLSQSSEKGRGPECAGAE